jgi:hypothetical protein
MKEFFLSEAYKITRRDMICKVSLILHMLITQFMQKVLKGDTSAAKEHQENVT